MEILIVLGIITAMITFTIPFIMPQMERATLRYGAQQLQASIVQDIINNKLSKEGGTRYIEFSSTGISGHIATNTSYDDLRTYSMEDIIKLPSQTTFTSESIKELEGTTLSPLTVVAKDKKVQYGKALLLLEPLSNVYTVMTATDKATNIASASIDIASTLRSAIHEQIMFSPLTGTYHE